MGELTMRWLAEIIEQLQDLYERLRHYSPPRVVHPSVESLDPKPKTSFLGSLFGRGKQVELKIPESLPKGLYMYGDVGCGKTCVDIYMLGGSGQFATSLARAPSPVSRK